MTIYNTADPADATQVSVRQFLQRRRGNPATIGRCRTIGDLHQRRVGGELHLEPEGGCCDRCADQIGRGRSQRAAAKFGVGYFVRGQRNFFLSGEWL